MTEEMKAKDATRYMVLPLPDMAEKYGPFPTEGEARKCAESMALHAPGVEYGIFQKVFTVVATLTVETKGVVG